LLQAGLELAIARGWLVLRETGVHSCTVRDVTNLGAGVRTQDLKIVPLDFALSLQFPDRSHVPTDLAPRRLSRRSLQELIRIAVTLTG
jgi:hypothetical protein